MNCCCGMVDRRKTLNFISSQDHCQKFLPQQISDTVRAGFEPAQNLRNLLASFSDYFYCFIALAVDSGSGPRKSSSGLVSYLKEFIQC